MDAILEDYKAYYQRRMQRYEGDPLFAQSYLSEKALYDCMADAVSMDDLMQTKAASFRDLSVRNGVALVTDQATCRLQFYYAEKETIKAKGQQNILDKIQATTEAMQIVSVVSDIQTRNDTEVLTDTLWPTHFFTTAIGCLENVEVAQKAIAPASYITELQKEEAMTRKSFAEITAMFLTAIRNYAPGWQFDYDLLWQHRHRKKCPLNDAVLKQRIDEHRALVG
ncbi:MAG: hypothetical protein ABIX01_15855 [Chitinophagaceae bacterium]